MEGQALRALQQRAVVALLKLLNGEPPDQETVTMLTTMVAMCAGLAASLEEQATVAQGD